MKIRFRSRTTVFIHDFLMVPVAWLGAYWIRFNLQEIPVNYWDSALTYLPWVMGFQTVVFWLFGLYRGIWRFSSIPDLIRIIKAVCVGAFVIACGLFLYNRLEGVPRSVIVLYVMLLLLLLAAPRFLYRLWKEKAHFQTQGKRALIVGAGSAAELLVRDLCTSPDAEYQPVLLVDDNKNRLHREIRGVRVGGTIDDIPELIRQWDIEAILIATPSADERQMRRIVSYCEASQLPFKTLPSVNELLSQKITQESLRDVSIEDILGRDPVKLDWKHISASLCDKVILVTGGGGSIGSELCRQLARMKPKRLVVFDQSEYNLYCLEKNLKDAFPELVFDIVLGDVADNIAIDAAFASYHPAIVFHAAAYKHVPMLEHQVREAVHNNLIGTRHVAHCAIKYGVQRFVLISTDKAVNPTNVMGATKRAAEILCQNLDKEDSTRFITVRFGNVLDSAGSVVPLFREQIKAGGPVTVTHPDITRYFMTIPEACQLIMQAEAVGNGGEIFVLDMGQPVKIAYLAEQMILLSGKKPGQDIEIKYVGLRPGEKLYEELFHEQEAMIKTEFSKLYLAKARSYDSNWLEQVDQLDVFCQKRDEQKIRELLKQLVPEFNPALPL
ncbi:polysaccharide biosynthesis protein [methane-oxidizing endosymbiont of Gigantopelta aegis]|uniref:polysaccharide biosynthesis protein n=1 Tax=methane-oxidizing endosymbiont of Gigantopelta aegis TaxID=2794938 RepID=UPI001FDA30CF|nr:nucleoside-diphosphate sugar epimerase/dehydratase [methane-oxidizing endosymbiont of Gigantopelta aegis]